MKAIFSLTLAVLFAAAASAQNQATNTAMAFPMESPTIDGSLADWPADLNKYAIESRSGLVNQNSADFSATFMVGYNVDQQEIYVAVEVLDDQHVGVEEPNFDLQDQALLYLDKHHNMNGGAPIYWAKGEKELQTMRHPEGWDPIHASFKPEDISVEMHRTGNRTTYEWRINIGEELKLNRVFGIDHFILDADANQQEQSYLLWTSEFGKSMNAIKLGSVILADRSTKTGWLSGNVKIDGGSNKKELRLNLQSTTNAELWVSVGTDTAGNYSALLPAGTYKIECTSRFTSPLFSSGFKQNTKRLEAKTVIEATVVSDQMTTAAPIVLIEKERPAFAEGEGILLQKKFKLSEFEAKLKALQSYFEIPGVSIALIKNNEVIYENALGVKNTSTQLSIDSKSRFEAASISKPVFAIMVLRLAERGVIDLDKPLYEYLPFPNIENDERSKLLTARIILNQQSGLDNWAFGGPGAWEYGQPDTLNFTPGTAFGYSGEGFNYLGRVLEHITKKSLNELYAEEIKKPFELQNTYFNYSDALQDNLAMGHYHQYPNYKPKDPPSPASSVITEASDFSSFVLGLMNESNLSKESYELIYTSATVLSPEQKIYDANLPQYVSHGFFVQDTKKGKVIAHGGNNGDYDCKFAYMPDEKCGYIIFTNSNLGDEFVRLLEVYLMKIGE